jgi:hypothetical protein
MFLQRWSNPTDPAGHKEKELSFYFKRNYLTISTVKFCEFFCTCSPSSLGQDPTVESPKKINLKFIWACSAKNGSFGMVFEKKGLSWHP